MPKKTKTDDTTKLSAMTSGEESPSAVESDVVSNANPVENESEAPKIVSLDDLDVFDPSATHEVYSEDDQFDDEDESF